MKYCILLLLSLILICCNKNIEEPEKPVESINTSEIETVQDSVQEEVVTYPIEEHPSNLGTFCTTSVTENNVNVRNFPSLDGKIVFQVNKNDIVRVAGVSGEKVTIDNFNGHWLNIVVKEKGKGWVFSNYINVSEIVYSPIKFVESVPTENIKLPIIKISYQLGDKEIVADVDYTVWNDYYIIVWDLLQYDYHYSTRPGVYTLHKETNELNHVTYLGTAEFWPHAYTLFTDDFEYLIQDSGTSKGVRGITAWRLKDLEKVYSGGHLGMNISHHTIEIAYTCNEWYFERGYTDGEIMEYGRKYREENPIPEDMEKIRQETGLGVELIIICSYNLDTGERKIMDGTYIFTQ